MRWDLLFHDLEAQADAADAANFRAEVQDRVRSERADVSLASRLLAAVGSGLAVTLLDGQTVHGEVASASAGWLLLGIEGPQTLIPLTAIATVAGLPTASREPGVVDAGLGMGHAMRALARDRARVLIATQAGQLSGLVGVVGADYVELTTAVGSQMVVPFAGILTVRAASA